MHIIKTEEKWKEEDELVTICINVNAQDVNLCRWSRRSRWTVQNGTTTSRTTDIEEYVLLWLWSNRSPRSTSSVGRWSKRKYVGANSNWKIDTSFSSGLFSASFFLLLLSIFLLLPEEDLMSKVLVCLYHRSSSFGEYSFLVLFLTCLPHQQLLAFSSNK